jgi:hypothetical protein
VSVVNIVDVSSRDVSEEWLWGCNIDLPVPESQVGSQVIDIVGWVLGRRSPAVGVEIVSGGSVVKRVPINVHRPDIVAAFPDIPGAEQSGFRTAFELSEAAPEFELRVHAVFRDGGRVEVGVIRGRHHSLRTEVEEVSTAPTAQLEPRLWGSQIERPITGGRSEVYAINVEGWVLGRTSAAVAIELINEGAVFQRIPINVQRPEVAVRYSAMPEAKNSGFCATLSVLGLAPEGFVLSVQAVLQNENRIEIGTIQGRRRSLSTNFQPTLQPLILTNVGRSGSTWLTQILGSHPQIITYQPFRYEPRVASYWTQVLRTLSEPVSYLQSILVNEAHDEYWWIGDKYSSPPPSLEPDPVMQRWLGCDSVEELTGFCQHRIEGFYEQVTAIQGKTEPVYFAERFYGTGHTATMMMWELYSQAREIFLVRDLRDVLCSMLAFNKKTGLTMFGRERVTNDQDFVHQIGTLFRDLLQNWHMRSDKAYLLRYEDLISHPEETLASVLEYLELDFEPTTVQRTLRTAMTKTTELQHQHQTSADLNASIGRWRRDLGTALQAVCQEAFGDVLAGFGYDD